MSMVKSKGKEIKETSRRIGGVRTITGILDALDEIKQKIVATNPLEEHLKLRYDTVHLKKALERTIYKRMVGYFQFTFTIEEPLSVQRRVGSCITALQIAWDQAITKSAIDENKNFQFTVVKGALTKLFQMINPFSNVLDVRTKDDTHILKLFALLDTILSALASIETVLYPDPMNAFVDNFKAIGLNDQRLFIVANWNAKYFSDLTPELAQQSFQLLLSDPENQKKIKVTDLVQIFERFDEANRILFLRQLFPLLLPAEKRTLHELSEGKPEIKG